LELGGRQLLITILEDIVARWRQDALPSNFSATKKKSQKTKKENIKQ